MINLNNILKKFLALAVCLVFTAALSQESKVQDDPPPEDKPTKVKNELKFRKFSLGDPLSVFESKIAADKLVKLYLTAEGDTMRGVYRSNQWGYESKDFTYLGSKVSVTFLFNNKTKKLCKISVLYKQKRPYGGHRAAFNRLNAHMKRRYRVGALLGFRSTDLQNMQRIRHFFLADDHGSQSKVFTAKEENLYYLAIDYENKSLEDEGFSDVGEGFY